jgi:sulfide:quinone oxidoreductase
VLIAGGGVAALEAALALRALARDHVSIELVAPETDFVERAWSVVTPFTGVAAPTVSLDALPGLGVHRHHGAVAAVDATAHEVVTTDGGRLGYDRLIVAPGARRLEGVPGAVTFTGPASAGAVVRAVGATHARVLFVAPPECGWTLPVYELALLAASAGHAAIVSSEPRPLDIFGRTASDAVARLLLRAGVDFIAGVTPVEAADIVLVTEDDRLLSAGAVVSLPRLRGPSLDGLPHDAQGFIPVDAYCRVPGVHDVFAAGDATTEPVKQGGLATQQADAAAAMIAAEADTSIVPQPRRRVLRGALLTGDEPLYLSRDLDGDDEHARRVSRHALWQPEGKVAGRYLTGFLARRGAGLGQTLAD